MYYGYLWPMDSCYVFFSTPAVFKNGIHLDSKKHKANNQLGSMYAIYGNMDPINIPP